MMAIGVGFLVYAITNPYVWINAIRMTVIPLVVSLLVTAVAGDRAWLGQEVLLDVDADLDLVGAGAGVLQALGERTVVAEPGAQRARNGVRVGKPALPGIEHGKPFSSGKSALYRRQRLPLADPAFIAVHSVVERSQLWRLVPELKAAGARDILVVPIEKVMR